MIKPNAGDSCTSLFWSINPGNCTRSSWRNFYKCRWTFIKARNTDQGIPLVPGYLNPQIVLIKLYMTSSSSSPDSVPSSTSTKLSPLSNFDPFAVHPFTSYRSSNPNGNPPLNYDRSNASYAFPCRLDHYPTLHAPQPTTPISSHQQSSPKPYAYTPPRPGRPTEIFVPFRQETISPELSDILKLKSEPPITNTYPKPDTAAFIPAAPIGHSSSQRHK